MSVKKLLVASTALLLGAQPSLASYDGWGSGNYLEASFGSTTDNPHSVVVWLKCDSSGWASTGFQSIVELNNDRTDTNDSWRLSKGNAADQVTARRVGSGGGSNNAQFSFTDGTYDGVWVMVAAVHAADNDFDIYIENSSNTANASGGGNNAAFDEVSVGAIFNGAGSLNAGCKVAEVTIFDVALTTTNIDDLQTGAGTGPEPCSVDSDNCIAHWSLSSDQSSHSDESGNGGPALTEVGGVTFDADHPSVGDVTAPTLSAPTANSVGQNTVTPSVTTNEANGTMYMVVVPDADAPSVAQIKAGQQSSGSAAIAADNDPISATGEHTFAQVTGLTASTAYELYFVHTDAASNDSSASTVGFTTSSATSPDFDVNPTLNDATDELIVIDYDANADADNIQCMAVLEGATAPTDAEIEAQTGSRGYATEATTGAADSITIDLDDDPEHPEYDVYCVLEEGTSNYSSVRAVQDVAMDAPTGLQFVELTASLSGTSPCANFNSQVDPDIVVSDWLLAPTTTSPGSFALTIASDCDFIYSDGGSQQSALNIAVFDKSVGDYHAEDIDFWDNNPPPVCDDDTVLYAVPVGSAMTPDSMSNYYTEQNGDMPTFSVTSGSPPANITVNSGTGEISGTAASEDEAGVLFTVTVTDPAQQTCEVDFELYPIDTITLPDYTVLDLTEAQDLHATTFPWQNPLQLTASFQCDSGEAANEVVSQDPAASSEVTANQEVTIVVASDSCARRGRRLGLGIGVSQ